MRGYAGYSHQNMVFGEIASENLKGCYGSSMAHIVRCCQRRVAINVELGPGNSQEKLGTKSPSNPLYLAKSILVGGMVRFIAMAPPVGCHCQHQKHPTNIQK